MNSSSPLSKNALMLFGALSVSGRCSATALARTFRLSQPTVSRALAEISGLPGAELVAHRSGRTITYALSRSIRSLPVRIPVYRSAAGRFEPAGDLMSLFGGGFAFCHRDGAIEMFDGLPWFLQDIRPQGYLGRSFCRARGAELGLGADLNGWSDEDAVFALAMLGADVPGNLVIGARALAAVQPTGNAEPDRYDELSELSISGALPGSSAGGEHPKFVSGNCIVKFSPLLDGSPVSTRWSDLLVSEYCAAQVLSENGIPAPVTRVIRSGRRTYLESERYDRRGASGRVGVVSMGAVDNEFVGSRRSWTLTAKILLRSELLDNDSAERIEMAEEFGRLIANSDMHFGNLSLFFDALHDPSFTVAPIYDMLPMRYAPEKGELVDRGEFFVESGNSRAIEMAISFWSAVESHPLMSEDFRMIAGENHAALVVRRAPQDGAPSYQ